MTIKIENVRNSVRSGTSSDGKAWSNRMAASYGEIVGTRGADGDQVDVFIGAFPESQQVWVINQGWPDGSFDEHKVVIGAGAERNARDLYLASFDVGWTGLQSMHPATIAQLKWWLRHGDLTQPFTPQQLPLLDGVQSTMEKTLWNDRAEPIGKTMSGLLYELRGDDREGLLLDSVGLDDLVSDALAEEGACAAPKPLLDALVIPVSRMTLRMDQLQRVMNAAGSDVRVQGYVIADPIKARGVLQIAVQFELSDGQAITIWFHNPDTTPNKLTPMDELVSWKWMLNKKDITVVVAPERGRELNPREVGRRVMRLAERNSAKFAEANKALAEKTAAIAAIKDEIPLLEERLAVVTGQVDAARAAQVQAAAEAEAAANDPQAQMRFILTAEGYASIRGDEAQLLKWQDALDAHFQGRIIEVRSALRDKGWEGDAYKPLSKAGFTLDMDLVQVGGGRNVVGATWRVMDGAEHIGSVLDELNGPASDVADFIDMHVTATLETRQARVDGEARASALEAELAATASAAQAEADAAAAEEAAARAARDAEAQAAADAAAARPFHANVSDALISAYGWQVESTTAWDLPGRATKSVMKSFAGMADESAVFPAGERSASVIWVKEFSKVRLEFNWNDAEEMMTPDGDAAAFAAAIDARVTAAADAWKAEAAGPGTGSVDEQVVAEAEPAAAPAPKPMRVTKKAANEAYDALSYRVNDLAGHTTLEFFKANVPEVLAGPMAAVQELLDRGWPDTIPPNSLMERAADYIQRWAEQRAAGLGGALGRGDAWRYLKDAELDDATVDRILAAPTSQRTADMGALGGEVAIPAYTVAYLDEQIAAARAAVVPASIAPEYEDQLTATVKAWSADEFGAAHDALEAENDHMSALVLSAKRYAGDGEEAEAIAMRAERDAENGVDDDLSARAAGLRARLRALAEAAAAPEPQPEPEAAMPEPTPAVSGDISYLVGDMFTTFMPDTAGGEAAWAVINTTEGSEGGKVLNQHADSVIAQLQAAGYSVTPSAPITVSDDELIAQLAEPVVAAAEPAQADDGSAAARAYLNGLVDGTGDLLAEDTFARLEPMFADYADNAEMLALLERAATAYGDAAQAAARQALAAA